MLVLIKELSSGKNVTRSTSTTVYVYYYTGTTTETLDVGVSKSKFLVITNNTLCPK